MTITPLHTADAPEAIGPYSQAIRFGNLVQIRDMWSEELEATFAGKQTAQQAVDFSVNQWLYLTVTFSTSSGTNSATLQQIVLYGLN